MPVFGCQFRVPVQVRQLRCASFGRWFRLPMYVLGVGVVYIGIVLLRYSGLERVSWMRHARNGLLAAFLLIYLSPFVFWFTYLPRSGWYYTMNVGLLLGSMMWLLFAISRLAGEFGVAVQDRNIVIESRLCSWSIVLLMLLPVIVAAIYGGCMAMQHERSLIMGMRDVRREIPWWIHFSSLVPLSLTMMSSWKVKEKCLTLLKSQVA